MTDLIWIGNTLYPRWIVFAIPIVVVVAIYVFAAIVSQERSDG